MTIIGAKELVAKLNRIPDEVRDRVAAALKKGAGQVLGDVVAYTPYDPTHGGSHARDGMTMRVSEDGLTIRVGLVDKKAESDYFWFRFLDGGTKGGEVNYWRRKADGSRVRQTMKVPARPALRILDRALDGNIAEVKRLVAEAVSEGIDKA